MDKNELIRFINGSVKTLSARYSVSVNFVDLLGIFTFNPEFDGLLYELSFHDNAYCNRIKQKESFFRGCLAAKEKTQRMCEQRKSCFFGICPHGLCEFVFPIMHKSFMLGYLCVGGFARQHGIARARAKDSALYELLPPPPSGEQRSALIHDFSSLCNMFSYLYAGFSNTRKNEIYNSIPVNRAIFYIKANYRERITLSDIAAACYCNKNYLCTLFRRVTGSHLREYINRVRVEQSIHLMRSSELPITEIALQNGFTSPAYYSTVFKKLIGMTPAEYKLNILKEKA